MTIANQIKSFHADDLNSLIAEAEEKGVVTQDWENESTEYDFVDGSVLIICNNHVSDYASR
jgi:hypothetical protein